MNIFTKLKATGQPWQECQEPPQLEKRLLMGDIALIHHSEEHHDLYCVPFSRIIIRGEMKKKKLPGVLAPYVTPCPACAASKRDRKEDSRLKLF
jgi:hypothetical protein